MQTPSSLKNIISVFFSKSKRERMDFTQRRERFLSASVQFLEKKLFAQKNFKSGLDRHDKLWYPVVTARLVKSNQGCETLCKGFRFLHSILSFSFGRVRHSGLLRPSCAAKAALVQRPLRKQKTKNGTHSLTTCVPRFLFSERGFQRLIDFEHIREDDLCTAPGNGKDFAGVF